MPINPADLPDYVRPDMQALQPARTRSETMASGTDAVHAAGEMLLPKWEGESPSDYRRRATLTEVADFYGRTIDAAVGLLFGADLAFDADLPDALADIDDDADGRSTSLHALARSATRTGILHGWTGVLADFPQVDDPAMLSVRDVQERALRPYLVPIAASQVLSWRWGTRGAESYLTQLVIAESAELPVGLYGMSSDTRYRVYRHDLGTDTVTVELLAITKDSTGQKGVAVVVPETPIIGPDRIPLAQFGTFTDPPLLDRLCWLNVGLYRVSADHRNLLAITAAPTLVITHADPNDVTPISIGPNAVVRLTNDQEALWLQASPDALTPHERTMDRQVSQMAALGMAFLSRDKAAGNETATGRQLDASADRATIGSVADGIGAMLSEALEYCAAYVGMPECPEISITPDYDVGRLDAQTIMALSTLATAGQITVPMLLQVLQAGDVLPDSMDVEKEAEAAAMADALRLIGPSETLPTPAVNGVTRAAA